MASNLLLIGALAAGAYLLTKKPEVKVSATNPKEQPKTGTYGAWWYDYDCKSLQIYNPAKWKEFFNENLIASYKALGNNTNILNFDSFRHYLIGFVKDFVSKFNEPGFSCEPKTEQEKFIYYILAAEAIDELFKLKFGGEMEIDSPEVQKWGETSQGYYNMLKDQLGIAGKETEIIAAGKKLKTTGSYP